MLPENASTNAREKERKRKQERDKEKERDRERERERERDSWTDCSAHCRRSLDSRRLSRTSVYNLLTS